MSDQLTASADESVKPSVASFLARRWWLFLLPAFLAAYFFVVSLLVSLGPVAWAGESTKAPVSNTYYEAALAIAPWHADAKADYGTWLRAYAFGEPAIEQGMDQQAVLERVLALYESAIQSRPLWPYYHLGAFDAEYLLNKPAAVIQERFDAVTALAPNERGLDRNLIELSLYSWNKLRDDQKLWVAQRLKATQYRIRKDMLALIGDLKSYNRDLCIQLPWNLVRRACRE